MFKFLILFIAPLQWVDCGCMCMDGVPKTFCRNLEEARQQANICPLNARCPSEDANILPARPLRQDYLDSPHEHAHSCREVRVLDNRVDDYTGVRVCDVDIS